MRRKGNCQQRQRGYENAMLRQDEQSKGNASRSIAVAMDSDEKHGSGDG